MKRFEVMKFKEVCPNCNCDELLEYKNGDLILYICTDCKKKVMGSHEFERVREYVGYVEVEE